MFRADETKRSQAGKLCVRNSLLLGKTLLFVLGSMEHMGPELGRNHGELTRSGRGEKTWVRGGV